MGKYLKKKEVKEALKKAKELEKERILTPKEETGIQREAVSLSEKLKKLLRPEWFIKDIHKRPKKKAVKKKSAKKKTKKKKR